MSPDAPLLSWKYTPANKSFTVLSAGSGLRWADVKVSGTAATPVLSANGGIPVPWTDRAKVDADWPIRVGDRFECPDNANLRLVHLPTGAVLLDNRRGFRR